MTPRPQRGYELIEHTADVGLLVWASTLPELFAEAAVGLVAVMGRARGGEERVERVSIDAPDREALFVDWLSEVLFLFEARGLVPSQARVSVEREPWCLEAVIEGLDAASFEQGGPGVKAVTYHGLEIRESDSGCEARVYLDV